VYPKFSDFVILTCFTFEILAGEGVCPSDSSSSSMDEVVEDSSDSEPVSDSSDTVESFPTVETDLGISLRRPKRGYTSNSRIACPWKVPKSNYSLKFSNY
jgi:hypothetical protein